MPEEQIAEKEKWLNELEVTVEDKVGDFSLTLKGRGIPDYFQQENETWTSIIEEVKKSNRNQVPQSLTQINNYHRTRFNDIKNIIDTFPNSSTTELIARWNSVRANFINPQTKIIHSKSQTGIFLIDLYRREPERAEGAYKYFNNQQIELSRQFDLRGYLDGYIFERKLDSQIKERLEADRQSLSEARNDWEQRSREIANEFDKQKTELHGWKENFTDEHSVWSQTAKDEYRVFVETKQKELENLHKAYTEYIQLEGPARFWQRRAGMYQRRGHWWLVGFISATTVIASILIYLLYCPPGSFLEKLFVGEKGSLNPLPVKGIILVATLLSFLAYLVRVFARMTFSSFHLERDAEERRQLTMVYLALINKGAISDKERDLVLQALFARADTGLLHGDSSPTMPSLNTLIEQVTGKKK